MGGRFWVVLLASLFGIGIAIGIVFSIIGAALLAWGVLGTLLFVGGILLAAAWVYDRRQAQRY